MALEWNEIVTANRVWNFLIVKLNVYFDEETRAFKSMFIKIIVIGAKLNAFPITTDNNDLICLQVFSLKVILNTCYSSDV